jgi:hypothetical protein
VDNTVKPLSRLLLLAILVCGLAFQVSYASDTSKPSVPEFTVNLVAYPYDVPSSTTTKIDEYTGEETVKTTPGYHVENRSIEIVITNQPFTIYTNDDGDEINLYYTVQVKGHFGDDWKSVETTYSSKGPQSNAQLDSEYTIVSIEADEYPSNAVLDFRVQALIGYYAPYGRNAVIFGFEFFGQKSGWSNTQTKNLSEEGFQIRLNEEVPEFPSWIILPLVLTVTVVVAIYKKRLPKTTNNCQSY